MREKVSNRLKHIMKIRNLKQVDIINKSKPYQKKLGISLSKSTLSQYINDVQSPDQDRIYLLSKTLNVGEAWLMGYDVDSYRVPDEERQDETIMSKINNIFSQLTPPRQENVLNYANSQLDEQNSKGDNIVDINSYKQEKIEVNVNGCVSAGVGERLHDETLFTEMVKGPIPTHDLALKVNGDSMEPMFKDGEIIFVEKTHNIKNGQIGIFIIEEEAYVKKVFVEDDRLTLVSLNKDYDDLHFYRNESVKLVGKVIL
ncbi:TPA: S24 family peptidase [Staphylococcus aureus]|nr:helix-turn-helix domain-containing protein [Staphylococcus aureus]HDP6145327.1 helix-turn-helix domain-containing protein [Staphylococcus aureus]